MCGILAICARGPHLGFNNRTIETANNVQRHRGPDSGGVRTLRGAALGARRLAILDIPGGDQPMSDVTGRYHIVYNGEIYNYRALRSDLEQRQVKFVTNSDTEVILNSYISSGPDCLSRFNGMFAFAIWDDVERSLFAARDRLGIKPLFYSCSERYLIVSSNTKSIRAVLNNQVSVDPSGLDSFLAYRYVVGSGTLYKEISQLSPGHYLSYSDGATQIQRYWRVPVTSANTETVINEKEQCSIIREAIGSAVEKRLISDVPVTAFLSGGLDSSILVREMVKRYSGTVRTFTIGVDDYDPGGESIHARSVSEYCNTEHFEMNLSSQAYVDLIAPLIALRDGPLGVPNEVLIYAMSKAVREHGKVVLSGEGADELFGGYGRIFRSGLDWTRMQLLANKQIGSSSVEQTLRQNLLQKYGTTTSPSVVDHFLGQYAYTQPALRSTLLHPDVWKEAQAVNVSKILFDAAFAEVEHIEPQSRFLWIFTAIHLPGLLERLDRSTMAASIEGRVPFVDHEVVETALNIPLNLKLKWKSEDARRHAQSLNSDQISESLDITKYILRAAYRDQLPKSVLERKKVGFPVPLNGSIRGPLFKLAREVLLDRSTLQSGLFQDTELEKMVETEHQTDHRSAINVLMILGVAIWYNNVFNTAPTGEGIFCD